jgi:hypothetical protein
VKNSTEFVNESSGSELNNHTKLALFYTVNVHTNITSKTLKTILELVLTHNCVEDITRKETTKLYNQVIRKNYFEFKVILYRQDSGLDMRARISPISAEYLLQYLEQKKIFEILTKSNIIDHVLYMHYLLIVCEKNEFELKVT